MIREILLYIGSGLVFVWGAAHIIMTKVVVGGFKPMSVDNMRVLVMEWIAEGLTLCFIGALVLYVTLRAGAGDRVSVMVYRAAAVMLLVMAVWTGVTGARTSIIPIKLCPVVKTAVAILFIWASVLASRQSAQEHS